MMMSSIKQDRRVTGVTQRHPIAHLGSEEGGPPWPKSPSIRHQVRRGSTRSELENEGGNISEVPLSLYAEHNLFSIAL